MQNKNQPQPFEQSPEAQEYLQKLQQGRQELSKDATALESEAFKNLLDLQRRIRELTTTQSDLDKEAARIKNQRDGLTREIDIVSGQMSAYAQLLVSAEGARRKPAHQKVDAPEDGPPTPEPSKEEAPKEEAPKEEAPKAPEPEAEAPVPIERAKAKKRG